MILAELQIFHSREIAPTRRIALGRLDLPVVPAPGFGGILLGGVVASTIGELDPDLFDDLDRLTVQLEAGMRIPQPRLRHRLQVDHVGLLRSAHRLVGDGEELSFDLSDRPAPAQSILAALYAAGGLAPGPRTQVMGLIRKAMRWAGPLDGTLVTHLTGLARGRDWSAAALVDPIGWALEVLGLAVNDRPAPPVPDRTVVQRRFRDLVRSAHPDHGGATTEAARRIADLTEARRILLAS
ncbi:MAG: hypothetical protein AB7L84_02895 [Acidimicrobiia bacterium]